jgi:hypothetical protein
MTSRRWSMGDRVVDTARPEWGAGEVISAQAATIEGLNCQRLSIRFERAGLKTLSTAVAELAAAARGDAPTRPAAQAATGSSALPPMAQPGWDDEHKTPLQRLLEIPEPASDPFRSLGNRLRETVKLYRFSDSPASLIDWAAVQTGLADPLSEFNRHELEEYFRKFRRALDEHLSTLTKAMVKQEPAELAAIMAEAPDEARRVAQRSQR